MDKEIAVKLSNGVNLSLNLADPKDFYSNFVDKFLKPYYLQKNDWNSTIKVSINEIDRISIFHQISRNELISGLLNAIETRLARDISDLVGVDKIEILFENIEDYVSDIKKMVGEGKTQEEIRMQVSKLVEKLNLFEISELIIYYARNQA
jgi:hypothetical protein